MSYIFVHHPRNSFQLSHDSTFLGSWIARWSTVFWIPSMLQIWKLLISVPCKIQAILKIKFPLIWVNPTTQAGVPRDSRDQRPRPPWPHARHFPRITRSTYRSSLPIHSATGHLCGHRPISPYCRWSVWSRICAFSSLRETHASTTGLRDWTSFRNRADRYRITTTEGLIRQSAICALSLTGPPRARMPRHSSREDIRCELDGR